MIIRLSDIENKSMISLLLVQTIFQNLYSNFVVDRSILKRNSNRDFSRITITRSNSSVLFEVRCVLGCRGIAGTRRGRVGLRLSHKLERGIRSRSEREHGSLRTGQIQEQSHRYYAIECEYSLTRYSIRIRLSQLFYQLIIDCPN